ncbi:MAG: hypothetical protein IJI45_04485, partial [Anaerolineaceae bacterium]|nr:hypothetical protein [Anaerolineaceae bacterium]
VTGKTIGKITEQDGFIPNTYGTRKITPLHPIVKNYGAYTILDQLSGKLLQNVNNGVKSTPSRPNRHGLTEF